MCCPLIALLFFGPRVAVVVWWIVQPARWSATFGSFMWPLIGLLFLPWTTLAYVFVAPSGLNWFDWIILVAALLGDLGAYGGAASKRDYRRSRDY